MSKEIYISTTPHETRLAIVEDEQLAEIYYERENEYTLAGSIYNGRVTRVLPGMQSSFVDIGLERDAFLYVTDFLEEQGEAADFEADNGRRSSGQGQPEPGRNRGDRDEQSRTARPERLESRSTKQITSADSTLSFDEPIAPTPKDETDGDGLNTDGSENAGSRRWRGRRGRRRGRTQKDEQPTSPIETESSNAESGTAFEDEEAENVGGLKASAGEGIPIDLTEEANAPDARRDNRGRNRRGRGGRDRHPRQAIASEAPSYDNSYAGYGSQPEAAEGFSEAIVLPGESIRKYRDPEELAAEEVEAQRNAPPRAEVVRAVTPAIEIVGWDGGAILPGETLSRRGNRRGASEVDSQIVRAEPRRSQSEFVSTQPSQAAESEPVALETMQTAAQEPSAPQPAESAVDLNGVNESAEVSAEEQEYEPAEGATASVSDSGRRELRRLEQVSGPKEPARTPETASERTEEAVGIEPDPTTYDLRPEADIPVTSAEDEDEQPIPAAEFTSVHADGNMVSLAGADTAHPELPEQNDLEPAGPIGDNAVAEHHGAPAEVLSEANSEVLEGSPSEIHAYGDGDFYEEEIDEEIDGEDATYSVELSSVEDGDEEYEEETLEEAGYMDSELLSSRGEFFLSDEEDAGDAVAVAEDEPDNSVEDAAVEDDAEEETAGPSILETRTASRQHRDSSRRHDRDRRGGRNAGDRGRNGRRPSMQTMDLPAINELLKPGQEILVQIAKEPIAKKGARITSHIALPGRFLVFMPTVHHTGVSRKISSDEERRRLKQVLLSEKGDAQGGFIVRTAADGASEEELRNDLRFLIQMWTDIKMRSEASKSPALIYHDLNLVERILRDQVTDNFSAIWVDTEQEYERVLRFLQRFQPSLVRRVKLYTKETPLFEHFGVTAEIDKALKSKVWLKSGGSIVINQTEALVAIDINTGKYVGKTARLEDTILKTNLDAIPEIVRQIRLRDLGGIIVIDFIDMDERKNRAKVMQALEDAMRADRAPSKILPFNDFGLVIMTRKRVKQSLERTLCIPDPVTEGTGMIKSPVTIANEIYVEMRKMYRHFEKSDVMLRVHPEVVKTLKANGGKRLQELEDMTRKTILVKSDPTLSPEAFDVH